MAAVLAALYGVAAWLRARRRVFLLDFACYKPPENLKIDLDDFMEGSRNCGVRRLPVTAFPGDAQIAPRIRDEIFCCSPPAPGCKCMVPCEALRSLQHEAHRARAGAFCCRRGVP